MRVSVEQSGALERRITVSIPRAQVDGEIAARLQKVGQRARIDGFRPGKAPRHLIEQRYRAQVTDEVISDTINDSYLSALREQSITPAGLLSLEPKPFVAGDDLQYVATVELYPPIPSPTLDGRALDKPVCDIVADDIDRTLQQLRKRRAEFVAKTGDARNDDRLTIDFRGTMNGAPFAGGEAEGHQLVLGEGQVFDAFEENLRGASAGESKQFECVFPAEYPNDELAGKTATFEVKITAVDQRVLPALDDAFAEQLGIAEGGIAKLRDDIKSGLAREAQLRTRSLLRARAVNALLDANPIEPPKSLVESEIDRRARTAKMRRQAAAPDGAADASLDDIDRQAFAEEARRQVILGLIAHEVIEKLSLHAEPAQVRERIVDMAREMDDSEAMINWYYAEPSRLRRVEEMVLDELVIEKMIDSATLNETKMSFDELMNLRDE